MPGLKMTPSDIELLMHCHVRPAVHPRRDAPAIQSGLAMLLMNDLIYETGEAGRYCTTPRGIAHIHQLGAVPFPLIAYTDYKGDKI